MSKDKGFGQQVGEKVLVAVAAGTTLSILGMVMGRPPGAVIGAKIGAALGLGHDNGGTNA